MQGPPLPPRLERPARITDLSLAQKGQAFVLRFTLPKVATDGLRLSKPLGIEFLRSVTPSVTTPAQAPSLAPWLTLSAKQVSKDTKGETLQYVARFQEAEFRRQLGSTFTFAVRGVTYGFRHHALEGELSNDARAELLPVSGPIEGLQVETTEKALVVRWNPPSSGATPAGYRVYRRSPEQSDFELRGESSSPEYDDPDFRFGQTYTYRVTAVFKADHSVAESEDSEVASVTPRDTFPPAPPQGISAIYTSKAVEIVWDANTEADLAGYNVYRSDSKEQRGERLNSQLLSTPIFRDTTAAAGRTYYYSITAVDLSGNESPASEPAEVETR